MLAHFPLAQKDELLGSLLARYVQQMGIRDDKVALERLFACRTVVPSPLLQGHITPLLRQVGGVWQVNAQQVIQNHSVLPLFKPFVLPQRYLQLSIDLSKANVNLSVNRSGITASIVNWPTSYKICPQCWRQQQALLGFSYWQRLFQCPGVEVCPSHRCYLLDTKLRLQSRHRHHFIGAMEYHYQGVFTEAATLKKWKLSLLIEELINLSATYVSPTQWTLYYQHLAKDNGLVTGARIDHSAIAECLSHYWRSDWLNQQGLSLNGENTWLLAMFRKHRRPFSYLQHILVWLALNSNVISVTKVINQASTYPVEVFPREKRKVHVNTRKRSLSRYQWLELINHHSYPSLKQIRASKLGAQLYSWLYRYDNAWLTRHKPAAIHCCTNKRVDWAARDLRIVKKLLKLDCTYQAKLKGPKRSRSWYAQQLGIKGLIDKKLAKLPLSKAFFERYTESVEEYQTRRLAYVIDQFIRSGDLLRPISEIERIAGLSRQRSLKPARKILQLDIPAWQRVQVFSQGRHITKNREN